MALEKTKLVVEIGVDLKNSTGEIKKFNAALEGVGTTTKKVSSETKKTTDAYRRNAKASSKAATETDKLKSKVSRFVSAMQKGGGALSVFDSKLSKMGLSAVALNQSFELAAKGMRVFSLGIGATVGKFGDFEQALVGVQKTTNLSDTGTSAFGDTIENMGRTIPVATNELLKMAQVAGQLGVEGAADLEKFTVTMARLESATDLVGEEAANSLARILKVTNTSVSEIGRVGSALVALGNNSAASESQIIKVASEVARATGVFGLSADQTLALGAALKSLGVQAQLGGSAVGRVFREIDLALRTGGRGLQSLIRLTGLTGKELKQQFQTNALGVFSKFVQGLGMAGKAGKSVALELEDLNLRGDEINKVIPVLAEGFEELAKDMGLSNREMKNATALLEESEKSFDTLNSDVTRAKIAMTAFGKNVGAVLSPAVREILQLFTKLTFQLSEFAKLISTIDTKELTKSITSLTVAFAGLFAVFKLQTLLGAISAIGGLNAAITAMGGIVGIISQIRVAFLALSLSIGKAALSMATFTASAVGIAGIVIATDLLVRNFDKLDKLAATFGNGILLIGNKFLQIGASVDVAFNKVIFNLLANLNKAGIVGDSIVKSASDAVSKGIDNQIDLVLKARELSKKIEESSKEIDFGIAGGVFDLFNKDAEKAGKKVNNIAKEASKITKAMEMATQATKEQIDVLNKVLAQNARLEAEIDSIGKTRVEQLKRAGQLELDMIDSKMKQLKAQGLLNEKIEEALNLQKRLVEDKTLKLTIETEKQEGFQKGGSVGQSLEGISSSLETFGVDMSSAMGAFSSGVGGYLAAVDMFADAVLKLIDFFPGLVQKFADIFTGLSNLRDNMTKAISNFFKAFEDFLGGFVQNFLESVVERAGLFLKDLDRFQKRMDGMIDAIPEAFEKFGDQMPELVEKFVAAMITKWPKLIRLLINLFVRGMPRMFKAFMKFMPELIKAIINGFIEGMKEAGRILANAFKGNFDFDNIIDPEALTQQFKKLGESLSGATSDIFKVSDLEEGARGLDMADRINQAIVDGSQAGFDIFKKAWEELRKLWLKIWNTILQPFLKGVGQAWLWVQDNIIAPLDGVIRSGFSWVVSNVINPLKNIGKNAFAWVKTNVVDRLGKTPGWLGTLGDLINQLKNIKFDLPSAGSSGGFFANGGIIPGTASMPGDSIKNDKVLAFLSPGEGVIPRSVMKNPMNASMVKLLLDDKVKDIFAFNQGGVVGEDFSSPLQPTLLSPDAFSFPMPKTGGNSTINQEINVEIKIEPKEEMNEDFIRNRLGPEIREMLKRESLDGRRLVADTGLF